MPGLRRAVAVAAALLAASPAASEERDAVSFKWRDSTLLDPVARGTVERFAGRVRHGRGEICVRGYGEDREPSDDGELSIAERRGIVVRNMLIALGVAAERIAVAVGQQPRGRRAEMISGGGAGCDDTNV